LAFGFSRVGAAWNEASDFEAHLTMVELAFTKESRLMQGMVFEGDSIG
jgi:hypothetical protein